MSSFKNSGMLLSEWIKINQNSQERISNRSVMLNSYTNDFSKGSNFRSIDNIQSNSPQRSQIRFTNGSPDTESVKSAQSLPSVYTRKMRINGYEPNPNVKIENQKNTKVAPVIPPIQNTKNIASQSQWYKMTKKQNNVKIEEVNKEKPPILPVITKQNTEENRQVLAESNKSNVTNSADQKDTYEEIKVVNSNHIVGTESSKEVQRVKNSTDNESISKIKNETVMATVTQLDKKSDKEKTNNKEKEIQKDVGNQKEDQFENQTNSDRKSENFKTRKTILKNSIEKPKETSKNVDKVASEEKKINKVTESSKIETNIKQESSVSEKKETIKENVSVTNPNHVEKEKKSHEKKVVKTSEENKIKKEISKTKNSKKSDDDEAMNKLIETLDKVVENNLNNITSNDEHLGNDSEEKNKLMEKILSKEFQENVDKFLTSNDYNNSLMNSCKNIAK